MPRSLFTTIVANGFEFECENVPYTAWMREKECGEGRNESRSNRFESSGVSGNEVKLM